LPPKSLLRTRQLRPVSTCLACSSLLRALCRIGWERKLLPHCSLDLVVSIGCPERNPFKKGNDPSVSFLGNMLITHTPKNIRNVTNSAIFPVSIASKQFAATTNTARSIWAINRNDIGSCPQPHALDSSSSQCSRHRIRFLVDDGEEQPSKRWHLAATLFPVPQSPRRDPVLLCELILTEILAFPDRYLKSLRCEPPCHLFRILDPVGELRPTAPS
jgi:hypothetical protein